MKSKNKRNPPQGKKKRHVRTNSAQGVRRLQSRLINQALNGEIDTDLLRAVTYACNTILKSLEVGELSDRLAEIERKLMI